MSQVQNTAFVTLLSNPASPTVPYYRLLWVTATKKVTVCVYSAGKTGVPPNMSYYCSSAWSDIQAYAAGANLIGLPANDPAPK